MGTNGTDLQDLSGNLKKKKIVQPESKRSRERRQNSVPRKIGWGPCAEAYSTTYNELYEVTFQVRGSGHRLLTLCFIQEDAGRRM